jgi:nicotinamide riboside transporter PnuC
MNKFKISYHLSTFLGSCITHLMNLRTVTWRAYCWHGKKLLNDLFTYLFIYLWFVWRRQYNNRLSSEKRFERYIQGSGRGLICDSLLSWHWPGGVQVSHEESEDSVCPGRDWKGVLSHWTMTSVYRIFYL